MSVRKHDYNAIDWHSHVYYDETSPSGLRWKNDRNNWVKANHVAGTKNKTNGRWRLRVGGKELYFIQNVVFILQHGFLDDDKVVDHIDGNASNNHIKNLRAISPIHNQHNRRITQRNIAGVSGIRYRKDRDCWVASVGCCNVTEEKSFSCKKYGNDNAKQLAINFSTQVRAKLNATGEGAFTDRHMRTDTTINSSSKQESTLDALFE